MCCVWTVYNRAQEVWSLQHMVEVRCCLVLQDVWQPAVIGWRNRRLLRLELGVRRSLLVLTVALLRWGRW